MLVHVEQAVSSNLDAATGALVFDLTNGGGASGGRQEAARLAGRPAERVSGRFVAAGTIYEIEAYVMVESGRTWAVAVAGPPDRVDVARDDFEKMVATFHLANSGPSPPARVAVGVTAPAFPELSRTRGPVVINFFAAWCVDCRSEIPLLAKRVAASHGNVTLIGVDCCDDNPSAVPGFLKGMGVQDEFRLVVYDRDGHIGRAYALLGPPTTAFLDKDHVLRELDVGPLTTASLEKGLKAAGAA
jgi:thiol-disulfide isomerase/thioredoxin